MSVPASRTLEAVLREGLQAGNQLRVIPAVYGSPPSSDARYANVVINGQALTIPNLNAQPAGAPGQLVYVLADDSRMWVMGAMNQATNYRLTAGVSNATFSSSPVSGAVVVNHGMPVTPTAVLMQRAGAASIGAGATVTRIDPGTFTWQANTWNNAAYSGVVSFYWIAIG